VHFSALLQYINLYATGRGIPISAHGIMKIILIEMKKKKLQKK
jgi:hypothetical protein